MAYSSQYPGTDYSASSAVILRRDEALVNARSSSSNVNGVSCAAVICFDNFRLLLASADMSTALSSWCGAGLDFEDRVVRGVQTESTLVVCMVVVVNVDECTVDEQVNGSDRDADMLVCSSRALGQRILLLAVSALPPLAPPAVVDEMLESSDLSLVVLPLPLLKEPILLSIFSALPSNSTKLGRRLCTLLGTLLWLFVPPGLNVPLRAMLFLRSVAVNASENE